MWVTSFYYYLRTSGINKADSGSQHISEQDQWRGVKMAATSVGHSVHGGALLGQLAQALSPTPPEQWVWPHQPHLLSHLRAPSPPQHSLPSSDWVLITLLFHSCVSKTSHCPQYSVMMEILSALPNSACGYWELEMRLNVIDEVKFSSCLILINSNLNSHTWLMATIPDRSVLGNNNCKLN